MEALIAMAISAVIVLGVYSMFSAVIKTKDVTETSNAQNVMLISLRQLFKSDTLQLYTDSVQITSATDSTNGNAEISFTTNNSIKLEKAVPVKVTYYVENGWLMRKEENTDLNYEWILKVLPDVTKFQILSDKGNEFNDNYSKTDTIFQFSLTYKNDENLKFIAGCGTASQTSITGTTTGGTSTDTSATDISGEDDE